MAHHVVNPTDDVAVADSLARSINLAVADSLSLSDSAVTNTVWTDHTVTPADGVTLTDRPYLAASYLVLEEDGTSHIEKEEDSFDLVLEEGGWQDQTLTIADSLGLSDNFVVNGRRVTQAPVEVVVQGIGSARTTQDPVEVVTNALALARIEQQPVEVVILPTDAEAHVTLTAVEVLYTPTEPPFKPRFFGWF